MKFVFCEGGDDEAVIRGVANSLGLNVSVEPFLGKDKLREFLKDIRVRPEFARNYVTAFAIVRDADQDGDAAFRSVRDSLAANDFKAPERNGGFGAGEIRAGIFIVGPRQGQGMIEDICLDSVGDRPEFKCVDEYFRCIEQQSGRRSLSSKAKVRVWMASHTDFDLRVGKAAELGYWPWENAAFDSLRDFLKLL